MKLLEAFFGTQYFNWWRFFIDRAEIYSPYHTHWLVRRSVHDSFQRGLVKLIRLPSSMIEVRGIAHKRISGQITVSSSELNMFVLMMSDLSM